MIKKLLLIIIIFGAYVTIVATDTDGTFFIKAEKHYNSWAKKLQAMDIELHVNKWVYKGK